MVVVDIFAPVTLVPPITNIQPWFHDSIIVQYRCLLDTIRSSTRLMAKSEFMPSPVQNNRPVVESGPT